VLSLQQAEHPPDCRRSTVNPVFEPTAVLGTSRTPWDSASPRGIVRLLQSAGGTLAVLAVGLALAAALGQPEESAIAWTSVGCAIAALGVLRTSDALERRWAVEQGLIDPSTALYNRQGLCYAGEQLLAEARHQGRPLSLVVLDFTDLLEVRSIYGRQISRKVQARVVRRVRALAGARGITARTSKAQFTVLLPGATREKAQAVVQRLLGKPSRIEFDAGDSEIVLVPDILCQAVAESTESIDALYRDVASSLAQARERELRRQLHLQRERERHSRPMSLPPSRH
jgi:diguanylate cyclase (GGDEF)-like protein